MDEKEEKEASYLLKLCRWHEANVAFKKLILNRYETVQLLILVKQLCMLVI